eukprot:SAG11_NODE_43993_length_159_cov_2575.000000_1_plen_41_part_10
MIVYIVEKNIGMDHVVNWLTVLNIEVSMVIVWKKDILEMWL